MKLLFDLLLVGILALPVITVTMYVALYVILQSIVVLSRTVAWLLMRL